MTLQDHISEVHAEVLSPCLVELTQRDMPAAHIALLLRAFVAGGQAGGETPPPIEVVVSGPDATGNARDTGVVIRQLFAKASKHVVAVGFAVRQGKTVFKMLADRLDSDDSLEATLCIDIRRQLGDTSLEREILQRFATGFVRDEWPGNRLPRVYYDPRSLERTSKTASSMHAKCVVIDGEEVLVTSANFTEAAQERNIELGLLVHSNAIARRIEHHFTTLIRKKARARLPLSSFESPQM